MRLPEREPPTITGPTGAVLLPLVKWLRSVVETLRQMAEGQSFACGSVTLRAGQTTTMVSKDSIPAGAVPILQAASGTWTSTVMRVTTVAKGSFTITHSNEAATDRVVHWMAPVPG